MNPSTIPAALHSAAQRFGAAEAVVDGETRWNFTGLLDRVRAAAGVFLGADLHPGDRVAVLGPNTAHWIVAALGALYAGGTLVPLNTRFTAAETLDVLTRSGAKALVVTEEFLGVDRLAELRRAGLPPELRTVLRIPVDSAAPAPDLTGSPVPPHAVVARAVVARAESVRDNEVSDILYTSGTTGRSKGAMSAHHQSLGVAAAWAELAGLRTGDRYLVVNPFFHSFGYKIGILASLLTGATLVPQAVFDPATTVRLIERERITVLPGAPTIYQSLLDHEHTADLSTLRLAVTGAAVVPVRLVERMRTELGFDTVLTAYGLTEAVVATMCHPGDDPVTVATTCGRPAAGFELRLAGDGEILLRGPNLMLGYLDDPVATAAAIDGDGWLHTGDIGRLDEHGCLTITDRLKDMYISGGFNVYPAEIEKALAGLDGVSAAAVIGVPDERLGEVGRAFVVTGPGAALSTSDVLEFCKARLANFKVPRSVEFRDSLPRNASGKVLKQRLREES
ncbi:FadD3 family acyl-CoA ligase [Crossiella cryophila]|uniref:Acyl-CoA synthetase (AMP-forming)/AMP-acid ligase II n=1 Tax=Crossiella cryophila TaxID=43355 RepID=A0A7W7FXE8_9PSEU|nr:FadD3 family acyl-CoA ligase [Crossiella cryophila]MBB4681035.1 acyl-CoA synthetase (AMP-forming)/AMP-acid ligase II [Crossiella cryophila]